ncbi:hypothetical protein PsorP6_007421 [Peronosclerospora sorghi]|uniref:Uncharacterized protein n=1 Tax=Peronosclerospora sorghi TaxID=230839 RepID=A0ACC0WAC1_9STRA|nr:hypothetical protein PsorP6_007421 [Peronosclerospora sorghi]
MTNLLAGSPNVHAGSNQPHQMRIYQRMICKMSNYDLPAEMAHCLVWPRCTIIVVVAKYLHVTHGVRLLLTKRFVFLLSQSTNSNSLANKLLDCIDHSETKRLEKRKVATRNSDDVMSCRHKYRIVMPISTVSLKHSSICSRFDVNDFLLRFHLPKRSTLCKDEHVKAATDEHMRTHRQKLISSQIMKLACCHWYSSSNSSLYH